MMIIPHLILKKDEEILLTRRSSTNKIWADHWHCVTGGIESGESPKEAIIRETAEEIGITIEDLRLGTTVFMIDIDYVDSMKKYYALELFFVSDLSNHQQPTNLEPLKQDAVGWFNPYNLPKPMIPSVSFGIQSYFNNQHYMEFRNV